MYDCFKSLNLDRPIFKRFPSKLDRNLTSSRALSKSPCFSSNSITKVHLLLWQSLSTPFSEWYSLKGIMVPERSLLQLPEVRLIIVLQKHRNSLFFFNQIHCTIYSCVIDSYSCNIAGDTVCSALQVGIWEMSVELISDTRDHHILRMFYDTKN